MTSAIATYQSPEDVRTEIQSLRSQVEEVLPSRIDPDRFLRVVAKAVIENPRLMACTRVSLLASIHEAAQLGLEPTGLLGSAYLVPYNKTVTVVDAKGRAVKQKVMTCQLIPGYRGLIDLARRSGEIDAMQADIVRLRDHFVYEPSRQPDPIVHRPFIPDPSASVEERDRGPIVGAYMLATLRGGFRQPEWMTYDEIAAIRRRSKAADDGPWVTDESEMCRKTVVRRGSKYLPLTTEFRRALELDEDAERDADLPVDASRALARSAATQMLLDRASARGTAPSAQQDANTGVEPSEEGNGALDSASPDAVEEPSDEPAARLMCGALGETGTCTRAPDHPGAHSDEDGEWPRGK